MCARRNTFLRDVIEHLAYDRDQKSNEKSLFHHGLFLNALLQTGFDKHIQIAVQHFLSGAGFNIGAQILDA